MPMNMSHCRHHNTLLALAEVQMEGLDGEMSAEERKARDRLLVLCKRIADDYAIEIDEIEAQQRREKAQRMARIKTKAE